MSIHYPRRPEKPNPDLKAPEWQTCLNSLQEWINHIVPEEPKENKEPQLHVGVLWGPRGSGKTSLLLNLADKLGRNKREQLILPAPDPQTKEQRSTAARRPLDSLFAPDRLDDTNGDHLFSHLLKFLAKNYQDLGGEALKDPLERLTRHRHFDDFKSYTVDTAPSTLTLIGSLTEQLSDRATFSAELRKALSEAIPSDSWYLLLVDDIDLVPHRGPELLALLHTYLRDLRFIVLLTADREQLVEHTAVLLESRHGRTDRSLALQTLAKWIPYEWHVPQPSTTDCRRSLFDQQSDGESLPGSLGEKLLANLKDARPRLANGWSRYIKQKEAAEKERSRREDHNDSDPPPIDHTLRTPPLWLKQPEKLLDQFIARNWRAVNRTYNRLATLQETQENDEQKTLSLIDEIGIHRNLLLPFLTAFTALDAHIPELGLQDALERAPNRLRVDIPRISIDSNSQQITPDRTLAPAPLDRLGPPWLSGRMVHYARARLRDLATLWEIMAAYEPIEDTSVYGIGIGQRALSDLHNLRDQLVMSGLEYRGPILISRDEDSTDRPSPAAVERLLKEPSFIEELAKIPPNSALFPRIPLSSATWLGWHLRQRPGSPVVLGLYDGLLTPYRVNSGEIVKDSTEPILLAQPIALTFPADTDASPETTENRPNEAFILLDIRPQPDLSGRALPLWSQAGKQIRPGHLYKLASNHGFEITPKNLPLILADVLWLFRQLRDERAVTRFHLALATSAPLAFFIGRELHPFIPVDVYEHDPHTSSYRYVTTLE